MYRYRVASLNKNKRKFSIILIDFVKNSDNQIIAINNNKNMVSSFETLKSAKLFLEDNETVDFIITDILGVGLDSYFISKTLSKKEKGVIFNNYADSSDSIQGNMYSKGQPPKAGMTFEQDPTTADYFFYFENLNTPTFALMFGIDIIIKAKGQLILKEM